MKVTRIYQGTDADMLTACRTISGSFKANIDELKSIRSNWKSDYPDDLIQRIDTTTETWLGLDAKKNQRQATANVSAMQGPARRDLTFFKAQIDADFKKEKVRHDEILRSLGFASYYKDVMNGKQEPLVQLLFYFKTNMTPELRAEIISKGLSPELIDRIITYAESFMAANTAQEEAKGVSHELKAGAIEAFNAIYSEVIGICTIAASYYRYEPLKKALFSYSRVLAAQGGGKTKHNPSSPPVQ